MTTAIPDIVDLVKILREQPEWAETLRAILLTRELLELPENLARLTARVEEFIAQQTETNRMLAEQQARLTEQQAQLNEQLARLTARVEEFIVQQTETNRRFAEQQARLDERLEEFIAEQRETNKLILERLARQESDTAELKATTGRQESDTAELKSDVAELKATTGRLESDTAELKSDVGELKATTGRLETDVGELKSDMSGVKATLSRLEGTVGRLVGAVGRLDGADLERKVHASIALVVDERLNLDCPQVLQSVLVSPVQELFDILNAAQAAGRIARAQSRNLRRADIILSAQDSAAQRVYVVIEISRTVHDYDVTRARERADIMAVASGAPTIAVAMGYIIPPPQRRKAEELGVQLLESAQLAAAPEDDEEED